MKTQSLWQEASEHLDMLFAAHSTAIGQLKNAPRTCVSHFAKKGPDGKPIPDYADLATVIDTARAALAANGLSVTQTFMPFGEDGTLMLVTTLGHRRGPGRSENCRQVHIRLLSFVPSRWAGGAGINVGETGVRADAPHLEGGHPLGQGGQLGRRQALARHIRRRPEDVLLVVVSWVYRWVRGQALSRCHQMTALAAHQHHPLRHLHFPSDEQPQRFADDEMLHLRQVRNIPALANQPRPP